MDTSDPEITFDSDGKCSHCQRYDSMVANIVAQADAGARLLLLESLVKDIKLAGRNREYDCIMGLSGGIDSTYVAYQAKKLGLRALAVHFDSGWNSELAVSNIENIVKILGFDLHTYVVDWEEMRDLQLAFFKASVANCDIPTDHAFPAILYREAAKLGIRYVLSGSNYATEFILPTAWGHQSGDLRHLLDVHRKFGMHRLHTYPTINFFAQYVWYPYVRGIKTVKPLNYLPYSRAEAMRIITRELNWRDYGGKHHESVFTRFFQGYYLPVKFGYDKRRAHLSSLINSRQTTRKEALEELSKPTYDPKLQEEDKAFVARKLGISLEFFEELIHQPNRLFSEFASNDWLMKTGLRIKRAFVDL